MLLEPGLLMQVQRIGYYAERDGRTVCDPVVIRYYSCPPIALVLPIPLAFGVCRCHITVYDCVQLNIGCNDLLTVFSCRPDEPVSGALSCSTSLVLGGGGSDCLPRSLLAISA